VESRTSVRYSEAFKQQVLRELEEGRFCNIQEASRAYGIKGSVTINGWIIKYGKTHLRAKAVRVETPKEVDEKKELKKRVRELEKALADAHIDLKLEQAYTRIACRSAGIEDVDGFKKKHAGKP
jgi:transposase-like protein